MRLGLGLPLTASGLLGGAPTILISTASLNSTGKSLTAAVTGNNGSLTAPAALTGMTVHSSTGLIYPVASAALSGNTITATLDAFGLSGETVQVDLLSSSNLRDAAGDTPVGQTNFATTNGSSHTGTAFAAGSNFIRIGEFGTGNFGGRSFSNMTQAHMRLNGSSARMLALGNTFGSMTVTVDGGTPRVIPQTALGNGWNWVTLFDSLSDGPHDVDIVAQFIDISGSTTVSGSSPGMIAPGVGYVDVKTTSYTNIGVIDGQLTTRNGAGGGGTQYSYLPYGGALRFRAAVTSLSMVVAPSVTPWALVYQDGALLGRVNLSGVPTGGATYAIATLASGLDGAAHDYEIVLSSPAGNSFHGIYYAGTGLVSPTVGLTAKAVESAYGDSITAGLGLTQPTDGSLLDTWLAARAIGAVANPVGVSGTRIAFARVNTATVTGFSPKPARVHMLYGQNDVVAATTIGAVGTANTFKDDYYKTLQNLRTGLGAGIPIYAYAILSQTGTNAYNLAIADVVNTYKTNTGDTAVKFIATDNWLSTANTIDGVHPNPTGYVQLANRRIPLWASTGFAVAGPVSGASGSPSTAFTVTLASGATFTGDQTITIAASDGGTLTPSTGSAGSGSVTVTPANGATSFTFTYTPASPGAKTLSFTNGQSWNNPGSLTYTAS